jgi:hypothetical protein
MPESPAPPSPEAVAAEFRRVRGNGDFGGYPADYTLVRTEWIDAAIGRLDASGENDPAA